MENITGSEEIQEVVHRILDASPDHATYVRQCTELSEFFTRTFASELANLKALRIAAWVEDDGIDTVAMAQGVTTTRIRHQLDRASAARRAAAASQEQEDQ